MVSTDAILHYASALAFLIIAGFHIIRLINGWALLFRNAPYPLYVTIIEIVIALVLAVLLIITAK